VTITQSALQTGALGAAVAGQESMAPISATALGLALLHEQVSVDNVFQAAAVVFSVGAVLWGIITLAHAEERMMEELGTAHGVGDAPEVPGIPGPLPNT
jgi:hypothetical protein